MGHAPRPPAPHASRHASACAPFISSPPPPVLPRCSYQAKPTPIILFLYCFYWAAVLTSVVVKWRRGSLFDSAANAKRKRTALKLHRAAAAARRRVASAELAAERSAKAGSANTPELWAKAEAARAALSEAEAAYAAELRRLEEEDEAAMAGSASGSTSGSDDAAVVVDVEGGAARAGDSKDVEMVPAPVTEAPAAGKPAGWLAKLRGGQ
jgi:hypothetical protein